MRWLAPLFLAGCASVPSPPVEEAVCVRPARSAPPPAIVAPSAAPALPARPLCAQLADAPRALEAMRAVNGDAFVLKLAVDFAEHAKVEAAVRGVGADAEPFVVLEARALSTNQLRSVTMRGAGPSALRRLAPYVESGAIDGGPGRVMLGAGLARALGVNVGDEIELVSLTGDREIVARAGVPSLHRLRVAALLRLPMGSWNDASVTVGLAEAQAIDPEAGKGTVTGVAAWFASRQEAAANKSSLEAAIDAAGPIYRLVDAAAIEAAFHRDLAIIRAHCR